MTCLCSAAARLASNFSFSWYGRKVYVIVDSCQIKLRITELFLFIHIPAVTKQPPGVIPTTAAWAYFPDLVVEVKEQLLFFGWGHCLRIVFVEIRAAVSFL